jgi:hypothetical protein
MSIQIASEMRTDLQRWWKYIDDSPAGREELAHEFAAAGVRVAVNRIREFLANARLALDDIPAYKPLPIPQELITKLEFILTEAVLAAFEEQSNG